VERVKTYSNKNFLAFSEEEKNLIIQSISIFVKNYIKELLEIVDDIVRVSIFVPDQRERLLEFADISYYQKVRYFHSLIPFCKDVEVKNELSSLDFEKLLSLPRVIRFTAALYSCGLPPEFIGTGML
jgi:phosphoenolpyruvate carboxylase